MPVIINDFEVVTEQSASPEGSAGDTGEGQQAEAKGPTPHQIEHIIERSRERQARLWAH
jgi:hypothetical protein